MILFSSVGDFITHPHPEIEAKTENPELLKLENELTRSCSATGG